MRMCSFSRYITVTCPRNFTGQRLLSICLANGFFLIPLIFHLLINLVSACCLAIATKRAFIAALAVHVWMLFLRGPKFCCPAQFWKENVIYKFLYDCYSWKSHEIKSYLIFIPVRPFVLKNNQFCTVGVRNELYFI